MSNSKTAVPSEELLARKWDNSLANLIFKTGVGFAAGVGISFLFFRRRGWPVGLGTGFGAGMAYSEGSQSFGTSFPASSASFYKNMFGSNNASGNSH